MSSVHVEIDRASKVYRSRRDDIEAIREVSLQIGYREFVSLLGPSGCGKSTLLMAVGGLLPLTGGAIRIDGREVAGPRREIGIVFQAPVLMPWRTVLKNILFPAENLRLPLGPARDRARALLEMTGIADFAGHFPWELSGGMQQRAAICRALIHSPSLLLMDEPFSALDEMTARVMRRELLQLLQATPTTVLFITHSISEAIFLADRILFLTRRPARIFKELTVRLPKPRDYGSPELYTLEGEIVREALAAWGYYD